jgi:hypothetical protein
MRKLFLSLAIVALTVISSCDPDDDSDTDGGSGGSGSGDAAPDGALADADVPDGARSDADDVPDPDEDGGGAAGEPCELPSGDGTQHEGTITADETWTAEDSPHVVTNPLHVTGATLTIEPCAVVRLQEGMIIDVQANSEGDGGALVAHGEYQGTTRRPIVFERDDAEPWGYLRTFADGRIDLEHVDLIGGGDHDTAQSNGGTLIAEGEGGNSGLTRNLRVVDVLIEDSAGFGVNLRARAAFTDNSDSLVIRGAGSVPPPANVDTSYPIYASGPAFSTIPSGSYTGNATDEIFVAGAATLYDTALRFHERGVPYRIESDFGMQPMDSAEDGGLSTLTIDAGVVIRFSSSASDYGSMNLGSGGGSDPASQWPVRLIATGTPEAPIVLTSAADNPVAGSWVGVEWFAGPSTGNVMSNVRIEYAGGDSGNGNFGCGPGDNDAALFLGQWVPGDAFIQDCTFSDSAAGGIVCGWSSDDAGPCAAFAAQNTFEDVGPCEVADHSAENGTCPVTPPVCL